VRHCGLAPNGGDQPQQHSTTAAANVARAAGVDRTEAPNPAGPGDPSVSDTEARHPEIHCGQPGTHNRGVPLERDRAMKPLTASLRRISAALSAVAAAACGDGGGGAPQWDHCESAMASARNTYGQPESIDTLTDDSYYVVTYWWRRQGVSKTFTWSNTSPCKETTQTFQPIP
jgi:hypothetical protein